MQQRVSSPQYLIFLISILINNITFTCSCSLTEDDFPVLANFTRLSYICENPTNFSVDNYSAVVNLWIDFINCSSIPDVLRLNSSTVLQILVLSAPFISNPEIKLFPRNLLQNLRSVSELQLRGFEKVREIDKHILSSLVNIRCLYFKGFGKYYMAFSEILSVLTDLQGTPLTTIVMDDVQSIRNKDRKLDLNLFDIPNVTLTRLIIDNSAVISLVGQLSQIQPSLTSLSLSLTSNYADMLSTIFDALFVMPNLRTLHLYGYFVQSVFNLNQESLMDFLLKNVHILKYIKVNFDHTCHFQTKMFLSKSLRKISGNNLQITEFADWTGLKDNKTLCFDEDNQLIHLDLSNTSLGNFRIISGIRQLEILNVRSTNISKFLPQHFKEFPLLHTLLISDNNLGKYIEMDINAETFMLAHKLVVLDFSKCNLSRIPQKEFNSLSSLQYLNLTGNRIQVVDWFLQNCTQLIYLDLSYNEIEQLSDNFTSNQLDPLIANSTSLSKSSDNSTSHEMDFLSANSDDRQNASSLMIDLSGNPLSCLCNASSFVRWMQSRNNSIFISFGEYKCLYPNGTRVHLGRVDMHQLENQCKILEDIKNKTYCPCDYNKLKLLHAIRYSLAEYYCIYPDGRLTNMKLLEPNSASKACLASIVTGLPSFVVPVVVTVSLVIIVIVIVIFAVVYRRRRPKEFLQIMECLDPSRLTGALMAILNNSYNRVQSAEELNEDKYDAFFAFCRDDRNILDQEVMSKLINLDVTIVTEDEIVAGAHHADIIVEIARKCRSVVLVLTPEFLQDDWLCRVAKHAVLGKCALVPFVYRPLNLDENELLFSNILKNYLPIYWSEQTEEREKALADLSERLLCDTLTWVRRSIATSVEEL